MRKTEGYAPQVGVSFSIRGKNRIVKNIFAERS